MLRDFKFLRSNSGRKEEAENVPVNPKDSLAIRIDSESSRAPFNPIQDPVQQPKPEQEVGIRSRVEKTPTKASKAKVSDPALPLRTPDRYGSRKRFGWAQKTEPSCTTAGELHEDGANYLTQVSRGGGGAGNGGLGSVTPRVTRTVGRAASSYSESNSTQTTPSKSVSKPPNSGFRNKADGSVGPRVGNFASLYKGIPISCGPSTVVNSVEVPHFDLKEDPSFWMDHNVQVLIRVRPLNSMERSLHGYNRCLKQESAQTISWIGQPESRFTFDHVACETVDQEMLFRMAGLPMVENCLSGYNSCMFAYGQTGSGKTHTMLGEIDDLETKPSPHRGMTPRIFEFLFARIQAEEEIRRDEKLKYNCKCSFLEIYNEQITDLLDPSSTNLLLREDVKQGVYVENLSEFEVYTVSDILRLLIQGSSNRKVAATNMNRESSRSHSVFTCVIESRWEKDSTTNLRFARLNLVDLAGSERQKSSGAEGERLKEAANINKSLSTLGHVIMVLVDMAHGKLKHVPYRDSRLTFLLQDSLGGNSKTMIIANVSPSICCAAETLNTLKFAQRAKLIQNNAVVNEDATGNVMALQHQIRLLKVEELSILKRHNVSRSLSFCSTNFEDTHKVRKIDCSENNVCDMDLECDDDFLENETKGTVRLSTKQLKSLETTLAGALRREQMAEAALKQLEAEKEQLNRLVRQREEDTRGTKMMLRFREDKIQKMESLLSGSITVESYLQDENRALSEEIQLLKSKLDKNPEVTRFALENIRLLDQLRRFQEFYEEGEREILLDEVSKLRDQLLQFLDGHSKQHSNPNISMKPQETVCMDRDGDPLNMELKNTLCELEECRRSLNTCLEENAKLNRDIEDLHTVLNKLKSTPIDENDCVDLKVLNAVPIEEMEPKLDPRIKHAEEILNLQLELDILNIILREERTSQEERVYFLNKDLQMANEEIFVISKQHDDASRQLEEAKSVIEALESQQLLSINELEDLRKLLSERELELRALKEQRTFKEFRDLSPSNYSNNHDSPFQGNLKRMHDSLEKAKRLNTWYQSDRAFQVSNEEEMDEVRRQVEAETAEVIVCMQEELGMLQQQVQNSHLKELEMNKNVMILETELKEVREKLYMLNEDNGQLSKELEEKDGTVRMLSQEWTLLSSEIEEVLSDGCEELDGASDQLNLISNSFPQKRIWLSEQVGRTVRIISEKEYLIEELRRCLENANNKKNEVECMLKSMRGATLAITEAHEQECCEKEKEMLMLTTKLNAKSSRVEKLENRVKLLEDQIRKTSVCATVAFVVVDRLAEMNRSNEDALKCKNIQLSESEDLISTKVAEAEKKVHSLSGEVEELERTCADLRQELSEERECVFTIQQKLEDVEEKTISMAKEKLAELKTGVSTLRSCMNTNVEHHTSSEGKDSQVSSKSSKGEGGGWIATETILDQNGNEQFVEDLTADKPDLSECTLKVQKSICANSTREDLKSERPSKAKAGSGRDVTILLLKKEIETALDSLKEVQAEMDKLREENKLMCKSEQQSRKSMKYLRTQVINLHSTMNNLEKQSKVKLEAQDHKLEACQQIVQEAGSQWSQTKENSYDHISRREEEAGKLSTKLNTFEKQISELQFQEELMLQRSNYMGSQLAILMKELDLSNSNFGASLLEQEKFLKGKEEAFESQVECFMIEWCLKDFESLILASELEDIAKHKADMEREHITCCAMLEDLKKEVIFSKFDALLKGQFLLDEEVEVARLQTEAQKERQHLLLQLNQSSLRIAQMNEEKKALEQEIMLLKDVSLLNGALKCELGEAKQTEVKLLCQVQALEAEYQKLGEDLNTKEMSLEISAHQFSVLEQENQRLQNDNFMLQTSSDGLQDVLEKKEAELSRLNCLEMENESLKTEIEKLNTENSMALKHLEQKNSEFSSSLSRISVFDKENCRLQDEIFSLEIHIVNLETHLRAKSAELDELLTISSAKAKKCIDLVETLDSANNRSCNIIKEEGFMIVDKMSQELCETGERISQFIEQVDRLECQAKELVSENFFLRAELLRKDDVLNGLLFDLSLLQESASNNKDHQDEIAEMESSLEALEDELSAKSCELEETMANSQMLETQLQEKRDIISALEQGLLEERESLKFLSHENLELRAQIEDALATRTSVEKELTEKQKITESLKMEVLEMSNALDQMNDSNESLRDNLNELANEKDLLHTEMLLLKEKFERELARADEIEAIANEAQQIAELRKIYADDKEAEVKLLERSVEELERTVDVLENKVDIVKGEAERQRLYGEELELELHAVKHQMQYVENANADMKRYLGEKEKALQEAQHNIQILEKELAEKDAEIAQFKAHISELNLHAEAQACEYKQKFKVLESMAEQVRPESHSTHATSSSSNKSEKHAAKPRGSGSPFKCIGLGMAQQIKSEKDEDLTAARVRIEELESLAFSRQKEIFALNARLAAAESMTHDVIRDLLGVKLDMTSYVSLLDNQQVQKITEKARLHSVESQEKEQEVAKLKKQLSEFIQERQGWLEEIDRKQAELIAVQIALEKLKQRDQLIKTENEMLKEENHKLKVQNEELSNKLRRTEVILSRVKEELACFRASCGKNPYVDFDEEQRLGAKLKETEGEKLQLAQKLLGLCSSVLKAAGITKQSTHINPSAAEEALEQIKNKITSMDRELQDLKFKELQDGVNNLKADTRNAGKVFVKCYVKTKTQKAEKEVRLGVLGASGYTGSEIVRLLANHPHFGITLMTADRKAGQSIGSVFPHLVSQDLPKMVAIKDADFSDVDAVFCCLPHGTTQEIIKGLPKSLKIVDLSADFRLRDISEYEEWYGQAHRAPELQKEVVYGLTEILREEIKGARVVANPGCYPTSVQLPLVPLIKANLIEPKNIIIDSKSGVSGAGRGAKEANLYTEIAEGIYSYGVTRHRHVPEIEQGLSDAANSKVTVSFTPHLMPMSRGMQSTIYVELAAGVNFKDLNQQLKLSYEDEEFVVVLEEGAVPHTHNTRGSNYCFINVFPDRIPGRAIIISVIDNLVKGASGQALQNLNLMMGFPENTGLLYQPLANWSNNSNRLITLFVQSRYHLR
ncbi:hypothetical protein DVH24_042222 [Malus domestica]|uniref:Probable N-acetyl-gamma-glutamyl-phosphate reductase, chloroplastic n=1 Tax=Malus domestica TaxID=3750 RepID=A0A498J3W9_MALDO|nr:hypothetical protein DVH24_042222 [Malus domestica]